MMGRAVALAPLLALAPVLVMQGLYVRRVTPRLPEPPGARSGRVGKGAPLRLLIVGDSAAAGVGARSQAQALSGQLVSTLSQDFALEWALLAKSGVNAAELADLLTEGPTATYDIAVVSIGVNDVTGRGGLVRWRADLEAIADQLRRRHGVRHIVFSPLPPMHGFTALPQPLRWALGRRARAFDRALRAWSAARKDCLHVEFDYPLRADMLASDGFHPGEPAYAHWARHLAPLIGELAVAA